MVNAIRFTVESRGVTSTVDFQVAELVVAGWTGRDRAALEHHMAELEAIGVARPKSVPCYYRCSRNLVTTSTAIQVVGNDSSGEVELVLVSTPDGLCVGVGSDHTDRKVETYDITISKQLCEKVMSPRLWRYDDVAAHWEKLELRSWHVEGAKRELYQQGPVMAMLSPEELLKNRPRSPGQLPAGTIMFGGTLGAIGGIRGGRRFEIELSDPVLGRKLTHGYDIVCLPLAE